MNNEEKQLEILSEWANQMSDYLLGYREGSLDEMKIRAIELKNIEKQHVRQEKVAELFQEIQHLSDLAVDIETS